MIVPDASVVLKWFLPETGREKALTLVAGHITGQDILAVPELLFYEVSNILTMKFRLSPEAIFAGVRCVYGLGLRAFLLDQAQCLEAIRLVRSYHLTLYDASYVALTAALRATFVTADVRLARRLVGFTFVKTLDEFEVP